MNYLILLSILVLCACSGQKSNKKSRSSTKKPKESTENNPTQLPSKSFDDFSNSLSKKREACSPVSAGEVVAASAGQSFNIKSDYGAIADGTDHFLQDLYPTLADAQADYPFIDQTLWDETMKIQKDWAAIVQSLADASNGDVIYLPAGIYRINRSIHINKEVTLVGIKPSDNGIKKNGLVSAPYLEFDIESNATWLQFTNEVSLFKKNYDEYGDFRGAGILHVEADNINIYNIGLDENIRSNTSSLLNFVNNQDAERNTTTFENMYWVQPIFLGKKANPAVSFSNIEIKDNVVWDYYGHGISTLSTVVHNIDISCNTLISTYHAQNIQTIGHTGYQGISVTNSANPVIKNNLILGALDDAIAIHRAQNMTLEDNIITSTGGRILVFGCQDCSVRNNSFYGIENGGDGFFINAPQSAHINNLEGNVNVIVENNYVEQALGTTMRSAITVYGGVGEPTSTTDIPLDAYDNVIIRNNTVVNFATTKSSGVYVYGFNPTTSGGTKYTPINGLQIYNNKIVNFDSGVYIYRYTPSGVTSPIMMNISFYDNTIESAREPYTFVQYHTITCASSTDICKGKRVLYNGEEYLVELDYSNDQHLVRAQDVLLTLDTNTLSLKCSHDICLDDRVIKSTSKERAVVTSLIDTDTVEITLEDETTQTVAKSSLSRTVECMNNYCEGDRLRSSTGVEGTVQAILTHGRVHLLRDDNGNYMSSGNAYSDWTKVD
jgi:hypothetical protein